MDKDNSGNDGVSRRDFTALSVAAGLAATTGAASAAMAVTESEVTIKTPDGTCDAAFIRPTTGKHPGVLVWTDIFGLRPSMRDIGKRLAGEGYSVLVPNPFYRTQKAPVIADASKFDFSAPADQAKMKLWTTPINESGAIERDATAYIGWMDQQKEVDTAKKIGTQGYCMGGPLVFKTAAAVANRVGAGATFHGGGLVTDKPDSPHLLIPKMKASHMLIAIAASDDEKQPDAKDKLKSAFASAKIPAEVEVYTGTLHGWCVKDMPLQAGKPIYNQPDAERAWGRLLALYKTSIA
ncbi:MAG TPA: dienelactone hydrolase family protein [Rhizomicrobium sp.]|jgi:carboxymethylenebutenolidase|nr:dienelactone hydrolase family protein [Rhizomicrobium sp.]